MAISLAVVNCVREIQIALKTVVWNRRRWRTTAHVALPVTRFSGFPTRRHSFTDCELSYLHAARDLAKKNVLHSPSVA